MLASTTGTADCILEALEAALDLEEDGSQPSEEELLGCASTAELLACVVRLERPEDALAILEMVVRPSVLLAGHSSAVTACLYQHLGTLGLTTGPETAAGLLWGAVVHHGRSAMREPLGQSLSKCMAYESTEARCTAAWTLLICLCDHASIPQADGKSREGALEMFTSMAVDLVPRLGGAMPVSRSGAVKSMRAAVHLLHKLGLTDAVADAVATIARNPYKRFDPNVLLPALAQLCRDQPSLRDSGALATLQYRVEAQWRDAAQRVALLERDAKWLFQWLEEARLAERCLPLLTSLRRKEFPPATRLLPALTAVLADPALNGAITSSAAFGNLLLEIATRPEFAMDAPSFSATNVAGFRHRQSGPKGVGWYGTTAGTTLVQRREALVRLYKAAIHFDAAAAARGATGAA